MKTPLTPAQHAILAYAHNHSEGKIVWFPDNIKGGARKKVLDGMFNRALITPLNGDWFIAAEGYDALGVPHNGQSLPKRSPRSLHRQNRPRMNQSKFPAPARTAGRPW